MPSSKDYLDFVLDQLSDLSGITHRQMMGEYIIYYNGKVVGGIYDDRFLVKNCPAARKLMPEAELELPYEGASPMLMCDNPEDRDFLCELFNALYADLPEPKKRAKNK